KAYQFPFAAWGIFFGTVGPLAVLVSPTVKRALNIQHERIPQSYPLPNRPRRPTIGYED
ncbi:hypothetical protein BB560_004262, partial [Smittium megazygosporum]